MGRSYSSFIDHFSPQDSDVDAPSDGQTYGRQDGQWVPVSSGGGGGGDFLPLSGGTLSGLLIAEAAGTTTDAIRVTAPNGESLAIRSRRVYIQDPTGNNYSNLQGGAVGFGSSITGMGNYGAGSFTLGGMDGSSMVCAIGGTQRFQIQNAANQQINLDCQAGISIADNILFTQSILKGGSLALRLNQTDSFAPATLYQDVAGDLWASVGNSGSAVNIQITDFASGGLKGVEALQERSTGITEAPNDGGFYARQNESWVQIQVTVA
jgi:hypothetical protein